MTDWQVITGDCLEVMPTLDRTAIAAVITDPPYGIGVKTNYAERQRTALALCNNFAPIVGDNGPFDPRPFLSFPIVVMFGANYYADKLPISGGWVVWDKLNGLTSKREWGFNDNSDCELIWTNIGNAARLIPHRWMGAMKESESAERRVHPTQKSVALMAAIIEKYTQPGDLIFDPFCGSGSTGVAAINTGRRFLGIEISEDYADIARARIAKAAEQARQGELFTLG